MNKILKTEVKAALNASSSLGNIPMPSWVVERVQELTATWYPIVKGPTTNPPSKKKGSSEKEFSSIGYFVNPIAENPDEAAERLQDFYLCLAQDMRVGGVPPSSKREEKDVELDDEDEQERDKREHEMMQSETRVRDIMEVVERTITSLFYDRFVFFFFAYLFYFLRVIDFFSKDYSCNLRPMMRPMMRHWQVELQR